MGSGVHQEVLCARWPKLFIHADNLPKNNKAPLNVLSSSLGFSAQPLFCTPASGYMEYANLGICEANPLDVP